MSENQVHIQSAHIVGYKSIFNAKVAFGPGLNIIIGKNGSGKSNLLTVLEGFLMGRKKVSGVPKISVSLGDRKQMKVEFRQSSVAGRVNTAFPTDVIQFMFSEREFEDNASDFCDLANIPYRIPNDVLFLDKPFSIKIRKSAGNKVISDIWEIEGDNMQPQFVRAIAGELGLGFLDGKPSQDLLEARKALEGSMMIGRELNQMAQEFTPVEEIRLTQTFAVQVINENSFHLLHAAYEFRIGESWYLFEDLSDGTQRMIYILLSLLLQTSNFHRILLLEEPEMGIHPHQLHLLLLFLKRVAKDCQVILTTHSPQVLDILDKDELDKIIIATYDEEHGSQFSHLSKEKKEKALAYMQDMLLSDYWRFSDLEPQTSK